MNDYIVDAGRGIVFRKNGTPITRINKGYVEIFRGRKYIAPAHRVFWESVNGLIPEGMQINHINGIKTDNRIANLEIVTPSGNMLHAYKTGLKSAAGEKNGQSKLTSMEVIEIRKRALVEKQKDIGPDYGISKYTVSNIVTRKTWRHI